jgi:hypothetical protein
VASVPRSHLSSRSMVVDHIGPQHAWTLKFEGRAGFKTMVLRRCYVSVGDAYRAQRGEESNHFSQPRYAHVRITPIPG